jgi:hypothetical protein
VGIGAFTLAGGAVCAWDEVGAAIVAPPAAAIPFKNRRRCKPGVSALAIAFSRFYPAIGEDGPALLLVRERLTHDPEKWEPVFRKHHAAMTTLKRDRVGSCIASKTFGARTSPARRGG